MCTAQTDSLTKIDTAYFDYGDCREGICRSYFTKRNGQELEFYEANFGELQGSEKGSVKDKLRNEKFVVQYKFVKIDTDRSSGTYKRYELISISLLNP